MMYPSRFALGVLLLVTLVTISLCSKDHLEYHKDQVDWPAIDSVLAQVTRAAHMRNLSAFVSEATAAIAKLEEAGAEFHECEVPIRDCVYVRNTWIGPTAVLLENAESLFPCRPVIEQYKPAGHREVLTQAAIQVGPYEVQNGPVSHVVMKHITHNPGYMVIVPYNQVDVKRLSIFGDFNILFGRMVRKRGAHEYRELRVYGSLAYSDNCTIVAEHDGFSECYGCQQVEILYKKMVQDKDFC